MAQVGGDKVDIRVGDVDATVAAIGVGAKVIYNNVERALTQVEVTEQRLKFEQERLGRGVMDYVARLERQSSATVANLTTGNPYKSLHEYDLQDAALFYGRSAAVEDMLVRISRNQLTVLHADSGAGKTSLLKAGIMPRLLAEGKIPLYVRPYQTQVQYAVKRAILPQLEQTPNLAIGSLYDFLLQATDILGGSQIVVLVDQFEELFTVQNQHQRKDFVDELEPCLVNDLLPVRWLFSMRTEWFGQLGTFRPEVRQPYANEFLLQRLNEDEAREIIVEPAAACGISYESGLVDRLLGDLSEEGSVHPPQLQLVCSALVEGLRPNENRITLQMYEEAGQTRGILRSHLDRVLKRQVPSESRPAAKLLIQALITSDGHRALRTRDDLVDELAIQGVDDVTVDEILNTLVDGRLLRTAEIADQDGVLGYELAHDYLLERIELDPAAQARKAAQELLEREFKTYKRHHALLSADELAIIEQYIDEIRVTDEARTFYEKSKAALARQRTRFFLGVGGVVVLFLLAGVAAFLAFTATQQVAEAQQQIRLVEQAVDASELLAEDAANQLATVDAERVVAQSAALAAEDVRELAREEAENAAGQLDAVEEELIEIFDDTGVVAVADGPVTVEWDGESPWTVGANVDVVQRIDPQLGVIDDEWEVGTRPVALEWDGSRMWVANRDDDTIQWIDGESGFISQPFPVGDQPVDLMWVEEQGILWIACNDDNLVQQLDPETGEVLVSIPVGKAPRDLAWDGEFVWVTNEDGRTLERIDPEIGAVTLSVGTDRGPRSLLYIESFDALFITNYDDNTVQKFDRATGQLITTVDVGTRPRGLVYDGVNLWIANENDLTIAQLDPDDLTVLLTHAVAAGPFDLAWDDYNLWVAVADDNRLQRVQPEISAVVRAIPVGDRPRPIVWDSLIEEFWVGNTTDGTLSVVNPVGGGQSGVLNIDGTPADMVIGGSYLWVTDSENNFVKQISRTGRFIERIIPVGEQPGALEFDGQFVWVAIAANDQVQKVDPFVGAVTEAVTVGGEPAALLWIAERSELWIANGLDGTVQVYRPETGDLLAPISVGALPVALEWDGSTVWVANSGDDTLMGIDPAARQVIVTSTVLEEPTDLLWDGANLWLICARFGDVLQIDTRDGRTLATVPVRTFSFAMTFDGTNVWASNFLGDTIQEVNAEAVNALAAARRE